MDPAYKELRSNALVLGAWLGAIRLAPYIFHAIQGAFSTAK
jgi:hypothetical protein